MSQGAQTKVARHRFDPGVGNHHHRFFQIVVSQPNAFEHRPCTCPFRAIENGATHMPHVEIAGSPSVGTVRLCHFYPHLTIDLVVRSSLWIIFFSFA